MAKQSWICNEKHWWHDTEAQAHECDAKAGERAIRDELEREVRLAYENAEAYLSDDDLRAALAWLKQRYDD